MSKMTIKDEMVANQKASNVTLSYDWSHGDAESKAELFPRFWLSLTILE